LKEGDSMSDHGASPEPELAEPMKVPSGSDKLLSWVSVLWLLNALTGAAVAIREDLPGELIADVFIGRDASAEFFKGLGTALSPGLPHIAAETVFAVLSTRSGRAGTAGAAGLTVLGMGSTLGALGEKITYRVLSPGDVRSHQGGDRNGGYHPLGADERPRREAAARSEGQALRELSASDLDHDRADTNVHRGSW
jgi:hypothetical protein